MGAMERGGVKIIPFLRDATPLGTELVWALEPSLHVRWDSAPGT